MRGLARYCGGILRAVGIPLTFGVATGSKKCHSSGRRVRVTNIAEKTTVEYLSTPGARLAFKERRGLRYNGDSNDSVMSSINGASTAVAVERLHSSFVTALSCQITKDLGFINI